jgi:uncharacterized lipoprotein YmbA
MSYSIGCRRWLCAVILLVVVVGAGCVKLGKSQPSDFYVLHSLVDTSRTTSPNVPPPGTRVGIMKANIPQTLARSQIVIYPDRNSIHFSESDRWGEPLEDGISRVIMENLGHMIPSRNVYLLPARSAQEFDRFVAVDVIHFGYSGDGWVELAARWTVYDESRKSILAESAARIVERLDFEDPERIDYRAIADAMSRTLTRFSQDIAAAIQQPSD